MRKYGGEEITRTGDDDAGPVLTGSPSSNISRLAARHRDLPRRKDTSLRPYGASLVARLGLSERLASTARTAGSLTGKNQRRRYPSNPFRTRSTERCALLYFATLRKGKGGLLCPGPHENAVPPTLMVTKLLREGQCRAI
ncbi:hypothetical protein GCM10009654_20490 [Streptomyces hebeiensis]|uniref:Uncharacterized protein n=1 Tax=Streptomyces hebeiensis TaxID=229486 RepID=A0ABP4FAD4_9ACTN